MKKGEMCRRTLVITLVIVGIMFHGMLWAKGPQGATEATKESNAKVLKTLPFDDKQDFADAMRGLIFQSPNNVIRDSAGNVVWNMDQYTFLNGDTPIETINPSLRRQAKLDNIHGLFKVTDRIYQVRGYDLSNMAIVVGDTGYIIIDPLTSVETAKASLDLCYQHIGKRPVVAVIYSHSHGDHWAGVKGVVSEEDVKAGKVKIIAPARFMEETVSEGVYAGVAMGRRAQYMFGGLLPRGPMGQVDSGLGKTLPRPHRSLIPPTGLVTRTGQDITIDGIRIVFQFTPNSEAPSDMNFYFPQFRALYMADNCVATLHNLLTPRGAQVRDAKAWAGYIYEALDLFGETSDVVFLGHTWPRWGKANLTRFLKKQGDIFKFIHDQTLRLANQGRRPGEIAEQLQVPDALAKEWFNREYYATVGWDAKAVYQFYLGWYDGNPANLNPLPPVESSRRYVEYMGGADQVLARAKAAFDKGDYRWVTQVVNHVVFADPENIEARNLQADALEQLGYQSESATFRNFYLFGAKELREGVKKTYARPALGPDEAQALSPAMIFDTLAIRINPQKTAGKIIAINWQFTDTNERYLLKLENSVLNNSAGKQTENADCTIKMPRYLFNKIMTKQASFEDQIKSGQITYEGNISIYNELISLLDDFDLWFNIVTP